MDFFNDLWIPGVSIPEKVIRSISVYFFLLVALRLGGKRELGQMNGFDLVVLLMLSNAVQNAIIGSDNSLLGGLVGATALLVTNYLVVRVAYHYRSVQRLVEGTPTLLISNGQIIPERLVKEVITEAELRTSLRRQGFESLSEVRTAILETSGNLTVVRQQPSTDQDDQKDLVERLDRIELTLSQLTQRLDPSG